MCNHYRSNPEAIPSWAEYIGYRLPAGEPLPLLDDIWPRRHGLVLRLVGGASHLVPMRWGVPLKVPGRRPGTTITRHVTNVRNLESPFWRSMLANPAQRCLVPFSAFAEPVIGGGKAEHWFSVSGRRLAAFAGIWRVVDGDAMFAFLTCAPNPLVAGYHPKAMPVILHDDDCHVWLTADRAAAAALAVPFPSQLMSIENGPT